MLMFFPPFFMDFFGEKLPIFFPGADLSHELQPLFGVPKMRCLHFLELIAGGWMWWNTKALSLLWTLKCCQFHRRSLWFWWKKVIGFFWVAWDDFNDFRLKLYFKSWDKQDFLNPKYRILTEKTITNKHMSTSFFIIMKHSFRSKFSVPPKKKSVCFFGEKKQRPRAPESLQHIQWLLQGIKVPGPTKKGLFLKSTGRRGGYVSCKGR